AVVSAGLTHMCRGNFRSSWVAEGGYDFVAEALFGELDVDGFFMEWDDERSGGFEPLRFVPKGNVVVLGLVTTKRGALESRDALVRPIEEAHRRACRRMRGASSPRRRRPALPLPAVRLLVHRGGQRADPRRAGGQAAPDRGDGAGGLGLVVPHVSTCVISGRLAACVLAGGATRLVRRPARVA